MPNIPVYTQQTETSYGSPQRLSAPLLQPVPVGQAVSNLGNQLMDIWEVQQNHQKALDMVDRTTEFQALNTPAKLDIMTNKPGALWAQSYKESSDKIIKDMLANPNNKHIENELAITLKRQQAQDLEQLTVGGLNATVKDQDIQAGNQAVKAAALTAADYQVVPAAVARNAQFAKPGPYTTQLTPDQESKFQEWVKANKVPFNPNSKEPQDYDMRGYWKDIASKGGSETSVNPVDKQLHFPDTYKTPYHESFSNESKYATPDNPFKWKGETLVDSRTGSTVYQTGQQEKSNVAFVDGPQAIDARRQVYGTIDRLYPPDAKPNENAQRKLAYDSLMASERGKAVAASGDSRLLTAYVHSPSAALLNQDEKIGLISKSLEVQNFATRKVENDIKAQETATFTDFAQQKAEGKLSNADVETAVAQQKLSKEHGELLVEHPIERATIPAVKANVEASIASVKSPMEADLIAASLIGNEGLDSTDRSILRVKTEQAKAALASPAKQAEIKNESSLDEYYLGHTTRERMDRHNVLRDTRMRAKAMWDAGKVEIQGRGGGAADYEKLRSDVLSKYPKPVSDALGKDLPDTAPTLDALKPDDIIKLGHSVPH